MTTETTPTPETPPAATPPATSRKVGIWLGIGIFLLPFVFSWFTLRKGHSSLARVISFIWLAVVIVVGFSQPGDQAADDPSNPAAATAGPAKTPEQLALEAAEAQRKAYERDPETALTLSNVTGAKGGFDTVLIISGTITNAADFAIKDPVIRCDLTGPSGTHIGSVRQDLFEIVPANGSKRFTELNMGFMASSQTSGFDCVIMQATAAS